MAMADYYLCDVCGGKCFYDANLNWENNPETGELELDRMGDMAAICNDCVETHFVAVLSREAAGV